MATGRLPLFTWVDDPTPMHMETHQLESMNYCKEEERGGGVGISQVSEEQN